MLSRPRAVVAAVVCAFAVIANGLAGTGAIAAVSRSNAADNPLAAGPWGIYSGPMDELSQVYAASTGRKRELLGKLALRPRIQFFGAWMPENNVGRTVSNYISVTQAGNPDTLVQIAIFRLWPEGEEALHKRLTGKDQAAYRRWTDNVAAAIGDSRVAMILEPDLAVALNGWKPAVRMRLARYAAKKFSALPRTTVYLCASDADWLSEPRAVRMLKAAGVRYTRGFALGATHYWSVDENVKYGRRLVQRLARSGIKDKHFVIDTADNGRPFTWKWYHDRYRGQDYDNAKVCKSRSGRHCVTLGIPPTVQTADPAVVDAYLWFGRPWLTSQKYPFNLQRSLAVARTTPY